MFNGFWILLAPSRFFAGSDLVHLWGQVAVGVANDTAGLLRWATSNSTNQ